MNILCFDPGNHTGWCFFNTDTSHIIGGTIMEQDTHRRLYDMFAQLPIDLVVIESFNLYPGMAQHMAWNAFYPVEVIGAIKMLCNMYGKSYVMQKPSVKKYAGALKPELVAQVKAHADEVKRMFPNAERYMEHTKDAIAHLQYYMRNPAKVVITPTRIII